MSSGINATNRRHLELLHRAAKGPFTAADASATLHLSLAKTRRRLSWLSTQGWLARVRRGLYATVPLGASSPSAWRVDGWVVATKLFSPCYVGGWSACEHWSLTEQLFRDVVVFTTRPTRASAVVIQGMPFRLHSIPKSRLFGTTTVWRDRVKTLVSDPSRTVADLLDDPSVGGGITHVAEVLRNYFEGSHRNDARLLEDLGRLGNRSTFKRLGYLIEVLGIQADDVIAHCHRERSQGIAVLDPAVRARGRTVSRWRLRVNVRLQPTTPQPPERPSVRAR